MEIPRREITEGFDLFQDPGVVPTEFCSQDFGNTGSRIDGGLRIKEKRAGTAREHVLDGAGHLVTGGPDDRRFGVRQSVVKEVA